MENLFSIKQAAFILKVHPLTVRRYIKEGKLKAGRVGGNIRIKESLLQEFNRDYAVKERLQSPFKKTFITAKTFNSLDPFLRLKGRGASLHLSS